MPVPHPAGLCPLSGCWGWSGSWSAGAARWPPGHTARPPACRSRGERPPCFKRAQFTERRGGHGRSAAPKLRHACRCKKVAQQVFSRCDMHARAGAGLPAHSRLPEEVEHVGGGRHEAVDALVVVSHRGDAPRLPAQQQHQLHLQQVAVLLAGIGAPSGHRLCICGAVWHWLVKPGRLHTAIKQGRRARRVRVPGTSCSNGLISSQVGRSRHHPARLKLVHEDVRVQAAQVAQHSGILPQQLHHQGQRVAAAGAWMHGQAQEAPHMHAHAGKARHARRQADGSAAHAWAASCTAACVPDPPAACARLRTCSPAHAAAAANYREPALPAPTCSPPHSAAARPSGIPNSALQAGWDRRR